MRSVLVVALVAVLSFLVGAAPAAPTSQGGAPPGQAELAQVIAVQERHTPALMGVQGVVGTAVGLNDNGRPAVLIFTERAGVTGLPQALDGVPAIVRVTGRIVALHHAPDHGGGAGSSGKPGGGVDPTSRLNRPVPTGVSTGHPAITAGTIGARVTAGTNVYALSNNHVYANENLANTGDNVLQPGPYDGGGSGDAIGTLSAFEPIVFSTSANNVIDAAIALSSVANLGNATPSDGYGIPKSATVAPALNMKVQKYGRTTRLTKGQVYAINATVNVGYSSGTARFVGQIVITPGTFSAGGDSGSLIVNNDRGSNNRKAVGLLFAGSQVVTIANPIDAVLAHFVVAIDGE